MTIIENKVILVTGSGRGFGRAMAYSYATNGAKVISVSRTVKELIELEKSIIEKGGELLAVPTDLTKDDSIRELYETVMKKFGKLDVLVNNAATSPWKTFEEMSIDDWDLTISVNLRAPFLLSKYFYKSMKKQGSGSIINISSKSAEIGFLAECGYCPSKYGLEGLTQCLALELQPYNIAVNSLGVGAPSGFRLKPTELTLEELREMPEDYREKIADDESMSEAFRDAWCFMALQDANGVTGQRLGTKELSEFLRDFGWEAAVARWGRKLTKAEYIPYDFPESVRYQTPEGGFKEQKFEFKNT